MGKIKVEVDDDSELAEQLRRVWDAEQAAQRRYREQWETLSESEREELPPPAEETFDQCFERVLALGVGALSMRPLNQVVAMNAPFRDADGVDRLPSLREYVQGEVLTMDLVLEVGTELTMIESERGDGPNWDVLNFCIGPVNLVSAHGSFGGVSLSTFRRITRKDLLSVLDGARAKVDLVLHADLVCKRDGARFSGFRIYAHNEMKRDVLATRLEPVYCDHPDDQVRPLLYADARSSYFGSPLLYPFVEPWTSPSFGSVGASPTAFRKVKRYRCGACGRLVVKDEDVTEVAREAQVTAVKPGGHST